VTSLVRGSTRRARRGWAAVGEVTHTASSLAASSTSGSRGGGASASGAGPWPASWSSGAGTWPARWTAGPATCCPTRRSSSWPGGRRATATGSTDPRAARPDPPPARRQAARRDRARPAARRAAAAPGARLGRRAPGLPRPGTGAAALHGGGGGRGADRHPGGAGRAGVSSAPGEDGTDIRVTQGWRRELVGEELEEVVAGVRVERGTGREAAGHRDVSAGGVVPRRPLPAATAPGAGTVHKTV
jgi:hypothetical protein